MHAQPILGTQTLLLKQLQVVGLALVFWENIVGPQAWQVTLPETLKRTVLPGQTQLSVSLFHVMNENRQVQAALLLETPEASLEASQ